MDGQTSYVRVSCVPERRHPCDADFYEIPGVPVRHAGSVMRIVVTKSIGEVSCMDEIKVDESLKIRRVIFQLSSISKLRRVAFFQPRQERSITIGIIHKGLENRNTDIVVYVQ